jgi:transposase
MPRPASVFVSTLRKNERQRIEKALAKTRDPQFRDRLRAMLWSEQNVSVPDIACLLDKDPSTVFLWIRDYNRFGFAGLRLGKSTGRPRVLDTEAEAALTKALGSQPRDLGYAFNAWTIITLAEHLHQTIHVQIHPETLRRSMKRLGYRYKRPKLSLRHKQNPRAVRQARRERDAALEKGGATPNATLSSSSTNVSSTSIPA